MTRRQSAQQIILPTCCHARCQALQFLFNLGPFGADYGSEGPDLMRNMPPVRVAGVQVLLAPAGVAVKRRRWRLMTESPASLLSDSSLDYRCTRWILNKPRILL